MLNIRKSIIVVFAWHFLGLLLSLLLLFPFRTIQPKGDLAIQILVACVIASLVTSLLFSIRINSCKEPLQDGRFSEAKTILLILLASSVMFLNSNVLVQTVLNTDRSRSIFVLQWIECAPEFAARSEIEKQINEKFGLESVRAFEKRVHEHISRGLISEEIGEIRLTRVGAAIYRISVTLTGIYNLTGTQENSIWNSKQKTC